MGINKHEYLKENKKTHDYKAWGAKWYWPAGRRVWTCGTRVGTHIFSLPGSVSALLVSSNNQSRQRRVTVLGHPCDSSYFTTKGILMLSIATFMLIFSPFKTCLHVDLFWYVLKARCSMEPLDLACIRFDFVLFCSQESAGISSKSI